MPTDELRDETLPPAPKPLRRRRKIEIDKTKIVHRILADEEAALNDRSAWEKAQAKWIEMYEGILGARIFPYGPEASSNYHVPLTAYNVLRLHAVLMNVFDSAGRIAYVEGVGREDERLAREKIQPWINYNVTTKMKALPVIDKEILYWIIRGTWIGMVSWVQEHRGGVDIHTFPLPEPLPQTEEQWALYFISIFEQILSGSPVVNIKLSPINDNPFSLNVDYTEIIDKKEVKRKARVEIYIDDDKVEVDVVRQIKDYEGCRLLSIPLEDWILSRDCARVGIQKCNFIMRRIRMTLEDVKQKRLKGEWDIDDDDWEKIKAHVDVRLQNSGTNIKELKESADGLVKLSSLQEIQEIEVLNCFYLYDIDGDGLKEQVIFTLVKGADVLVNAQRLEEKYRSGIRPIFKTVFIPKEDSPYGKGLPELLEDTQDLFNELFDLLVDYTKITAAPFGIYRPASGFRPEKTYYEPGSLLPVDNVTQDIAFPTWPQQNQAGLLNIIGMLNTFAEKLTSQGAIQFGQVPTGKATALRTLGTFQGLLQQGDIIANKILKRLYEGIEELFNLVYLHSKERMPDEMFRVTGQDGRPEFLTITREELRARVNFKFSATTESENRAVQREVAMAMVGTLLTPIAIQSGIVGQDNIYNILKDFIESLPKLDVEAFITKPQMLEAGPILDAEQVIALLSQGEKPKVNPAANLQDHVERIMAFLQSDPLSLGVPLDVIPLFEEYLEEATQMLNALAMRQQLAQAAQQSQNIFAQILGGGGGGVPTTAQPVDGFTGFAEGLQAEQERFV